MSILAANSHILCRELYCKDQQQNLLTGGGGGGGALLQLQKNSFFGTDRSSSCSYTYSDKKIGFGLGRRSRRDLVRAHGFWPDLTRPTSVDMEPINDSDHLDQILDNAQQLSQPIIIDWMASWCRKCIYLKPKLEKLAAEYDTKIKFYYVDVNKVPKALVKRGNISKMPTIQLWKDGEMKAEVIGGHQAWLVLDEVREMIQKFV